MDKLHPARRATDSHLKPELHPLFAPLMAAIHQALHGKGERHGGGRTPFLEQPIFHYARMHGRGFLTGQAAKKLEEAVSTRDGEAFVNEVLGAIVYLGAAIIREQQLAVERGHDSIVLRGFGEPAAGQVRGASPQLKAALYEYTNAAGRATAMAQQGNPERSWQDYQDSRNSVLGAPAPARNCTTCLHEPREHTEWPCNQCSDNPQVLPNWEPRQG